MSSGQADRLLRRLAVVRARLGAAAPYSPDWDAAMAELEELEAQLGETDAEDTPTRLGGQGATAA